MSMSPQVTDPKMSCEVCGTVAGEYDLLMSSWRCSRCGRIMDIVKCQFCGSQDLAHIPKSEDCKLRQRLNSMEERIGNLEENLLDLATTVVDVTKSLNYVRDALKLSGLRGNLLFNLIDAFRTHIHDNTGVYGKPVFSPKLLEEDLKEINAMGAELISNYTGDPEASK